MNKLWLPIIFAVGVIIYLLFVHKSETNITVSFSPEIAGKPLKFDGTVYPLKFGSIKVSNFKFYISHIRLMTQNPNDDYQEPNSYHLIRFDTPATPPQVQLQNIPSEQYQKIEFTVGVDKKANKSLAIIGDLDPNNSMAWSWEVGYKFLVFEGKLLTDKSNSKKRWRPLVYHVGFSENSRKVILNLPEGFDENGKLNIKVNIDKLFSSVHTINPQTMPSIKFSRKEAKQMADNYQAMFSIEQ